MRFKSKRLRIMAGEYLEAAPLLNCVFLLFLFFVLMCNYASSNEAGIKVRLPKAVTSTAVAEGAAVVTITRERLIYFAGRAVSIKDLASKLKSLQNKDVLLIKADKGTSLERVVEVWDVCRDAEISQVNIATTQAK